MSDPSEGAPFSNWLWENMPTFTLLPMSTATPSTGQVLGNGWGLSFETCASFENTPIKFETSAQGEEVEGRGW